MYFSGTASMLYYNVKKKQGAECRNILTFGGFGFALRRSYSLRIVSTQNLSHTTVMPVVSSGTRTRNLRRT